MAVLVKVGVGGTGVWVKVLVGNPGVFVFVGVTELEVVNPVNSKRR